MTMGSLFGSAYAEQDYASQNPGDIPSYPWAPNYEPEEDPAALWAQQEEELRQQGLMAQFAYPSGAPATYGPQYVPSALEQAASGIGGSVLGNISNFAQENLLPALQQTIIGGRPIGYSQGPAAFPAPTYGQGAQAEIPYAVGAQEAFGDVGQSLGDPVGLGGVGRFIAGSLMPTNVGDVALMSGLAGTAATPFEAITGIPSPLGAIRGGVDNAIRFASPEPQLYPGLGSSGGGYDYLRYLKENAAEAVDPRYPLPIDPLDPITQARAARAGPGYIEGGTTPGIIDSIEQAHPPNVAGYGQPVAIEGGRAFPAGGFPDNVIPEAPLPSRLDAFNVESPSVRRGGAIPPEFPPIETPSQGQVIRIAVQPDAVRPLEDFIAPGKGFELTNPAGARVLGPGEIPAPGELLMHHGTGPAGIQGTPRAGMNLASDPAIAESIARFEARAQGTSLATPPPASLTPEANALWDQLTGGGGVARAVPGESFHPAEQAFDLAERNAPPLSYYPESPANAYDLVGSRPGPPNPEIVGPQGNFTASTPPVALLPERGVAASRIDDLLRESGAVRPAQLDAMSGLAAREAGLSAPIVRDVPLDEQIKAAQTMGRPDLAEQLQKGTELTKDGARDVLQAQLDLDAAIRYGTWTQGGGNLPPGGRTAVGGGSEANRLGLPGKVHKAINEVLYGLQFAGDQSSVFRQTVMRTINPLYLPDTIRSVRLTFNAITDPAKAELIDDALRSLPQSERLNVAHKFADWRSGSDFINREGAVSGIFNKIPGYEAMNRGVATMINAQRVLPAEKIYENIPNITRAQAQDVANVSALATGRGVLGPAQLEKAFANLLGPIMTSARYAASWPERAASLVPVHRVMCETIWFGPGWRMAVKDTAGYVIAGYTIMQLADKAGADVDWERGLIKIGNETRDIWGGGYSYLKLAMELRSGERNGKDYPRLLELGKDDKYRGMIAEFLRNKTGPVPEATLAGLRETGIDKALGITTETNFLRPEYWDRGVTGQNKGLLDRAAQFVTFLYIQSAVEAAFEKEGSLGAKIATGLGAGATDFLGMATQTWQAFPSAELSNLRNAALPDGIAYKDLLPKEQAGLDKALAAAHPEEFKQAQQKAQAGQDPALQAYRTVRDANNKAEFGRVDTIVKGVQAGTYNPTAARLAIKEISAETSQKNAELRKTPED